jgi:ribosomal protein S18 acetylase RimI-like enzyme
MKIVVRRASVADSELVSALNSDVQAVHAVALPSRFKPPPLGSLPEADVATLLAKAETTVFLAYLDGTPAGYAYAEVVRRAETPLTYSYDMIHIHHISVRSNHRRLGVGSALLSAVRALGTDLSISLITLEVWSFNEAARAFFRRHGFDLYIERLWWQCPSLGEQAPPFRQ